MSSSRTHTVTTEEGATFNYTFRGLEESEIKEWTEFCASIFAYKTNPPAPSYFERHYKNDPDRKASYIRVAFFEGKMVASVRIFRRVLSDGNGGTIKAGGIGEVCTDSSHRRRGLSKELLQDAISIMQASDMAVSLLHAAPSFFPVYESVGYQGTHSKWSVIDVDLSTIELDARVRLASFSSDTSELMDMHQQYSGHRFAGCIIRTEKYWNEYISEELKDSLHVLTDQDGEIQAYLSIRPRGDRYQLRDFGCTEGDESRVFLPLLKTAVDSIGLLAITLHLPTFVASKLPYSATEEDDFGWMYKSLRDEAPSMPELCNKVSHLIWPADSF